MLGKPAKAILVKLTICPCGHPVLVDSIKLGTVFTVYPETEEAGKYMCGQCKQLTSVRVVHANSVTHPEDPPRLMIFDLFEVMKEDYVN